MLYREMGKTGEKLSILGYGCMRFPKKGRGIDEERTERQVISAIDRGVNYMDTAYIYNNGGSEVVLGKILAKGYRDRVNVATKLPIPLVHSIGDMEKLLDTQLKRLQTDRIDYYLAHALTSMASWQRLRQLGIDRFFENARQAGKIRWVGFSFHGDGDQFKEIVDDYPWDFCQIQYNYMDEQFQAGRKGLVHAASKGLGVVIMEPLRGGYLGGKMPPEVKALWDRAESKRSPAEWALRWIWNQPEVTVVLSGMNEEAHIDENIRVAGDAYPESLSADELKLIGDVRDSLSSMMKVGCTGCGYCMPCPSGVNIPICFSYFNNMHLFGDRGLRFSYMGFTGGMDGGSPPYASLCRDCGKCEKACPQGLPIREHLREVAKEMQPFYFEPAVGLIRGYYRIRRLLRRGKGSRGL